MQQILVNSFPSNEVNKKCLSFDPVVVLWSCTWSCHDMTRILQAIIGIFYSSKTVRLSEDTTSDSQTKPRPCNLPTSNHSVQRWPSCPETSGCLVILDVWYIRFVQISGYDWMVYYSHTDNVWHWTDRLTRELTSWVDQANPLP